MEQRRFTGETRLGGVVGEAEQRRVFVCDAEGEGFGGDWGEGMKKGVCIV